MAQDGTIFGWLGAVHPRFGTPHRAIAAAGGVGGRAGVTNTYGALFSRVIYTEWIFFAAMAAGLMLLRRRPDYQPVYRLWGYPIVPLLFIAASIVVVVIQMIGRAGRQLRSDWGWSCSAGRYILSGRDDARAPASDFSSNDHRLP